MVNHTTPQAGYSDYSDLIKLTTMSAHMVGELLSGDHKASAAAAGGGGGSKAAVADGAGE